MKVLKNILISIAFFALGISVFSIYLPINENDGLYVLAFTLQLIIIYIYNASKSNKRFSFFSLLLIFSNTINLIIYIVWLMQIKAQEVTNGLENIFAELGMGIMITIQAIVLFIILIEFSVLMIRRIKNKNSEQLS